MYPGTVKVLKEKNDNFLVPFTSCNLNDHISFNLGRGQSRDDLKSSW